MEPGSTNQNDTFIRRVIDIATVVISLLCVWLITLTIIGYGHVTFALPVSAQLQINGHITKPGTLKMRSGTYKIIVKTPTYAEYDGTLKVSNFSHITYQPALKTRSVNAIAGSVLGGSGLYGPPLLTNVKWFNNNTYMASIVGPGSAQGMVLHYSDGAWHMAYYEGSQGYPSDVSKLPSDIGAYITATEAYYAAQ